MSAPTTAAPAALEARGWSWRYATRQRWALRRVSLRIEPGERVLLLGASGSGKSTLLQGLAGVLGGADEGEAEGELVVDGQPAAQTRGRVGMVLQDPETQTILARVGDDVAFGCENLAVPREEIWPRVDDALTAVGLDLPRDHPTTALSGGQKQRLALAGILAMQPGALLLDEPTANLDPAGAADVRDAVSAVLRATGATLVVIEHRIDVWLPLVTRVIVLGEEGDSTVVVADGPPDEVLGARGAELADTGIWVPGYPPPFPSGPPVVQGSPNDTLLVAEGLVASRRPGQPVAGPFDISLRAGEVLGITGPSGAGKTTLGLTLAGLLAAEAGQVVASEALLSGAGTDTGRASGGESVRAGESRAHARSFLRRGRRRARDGEGGRLTDPFSWTSRALLTRIGTVLQSPEHQLLGRTVREELAIGPRALGMDEAEIDVISGELMDRLRLRALAEANPYTLSGGEKRRLTVAAALATRPRILVLDEPTFGQDARTWAELVALVAQVRDEGTAGVVISHDEDVLRALGARRVEVRG